MIRFILFFLIEVIVWIGLRLFRRLWNPGNSSVHRGNARNAESSREFRDVQDADFEEIDPEKNGG